MGVGGFGGFKAVGRQVRAQQLKVAERLQRYKDARRKRRGLEDASADEPLVCPSCGSAFEFGDECPECGVDLVGQSLAEGAESVGQSGYSWKDGLVLIAGPLAILVGGFLMMNC